MGRCPSHKHLYQKKRKELEDPYLPRIDQDSCGGGIRVPRHFSLGLLFLEKIKNNFLIFS